MSKHYVRKCEKLESVKSIYTHIEKSLAWLGDEIQNLKLNQKSSKKLNKKCNKISRSATYAK